MTSTNLFKFIFLVSILVDTNCTYADDVNGTIVEIETGKIRGRISKSENGNDYYSFQEIPYAAKPTGENRFQLPKSPEPWSDILNATEGTKICYQFEPQLSSSEMSEDCLYLNVYTPQKPGSDNLLPVLFWIHGGGLQSGSSTMYGPKYFMDHGVVVVTTNYRLGAFGFVGTDDGVIPPNLGLKDQLFAMQWVNRNIKAFSGNPEQVIIAGESAGSISVGYHLIGPWVDDKQIFHGAIMQSGSALADELKLANTTDSAFKMALAIDPTFSSQDTKELLKFLQSVNATDIVNSGVSNGVALEKNGGLISEDAYPAYLNQNYKKVPVLIGFNSEEFLFFYRENETVLKQLDENPSKLIGTMINMSQENRTVAGNLLKQLYTNNTSFEENVGGYIRYGSDHMFITATCKQVELASPDAPHYFYQLSYKGEIAGNMTNTNTLPPGVGNVAHGEDLCYMWDLGSNSDLSQFPEQDGVMLHNIVKLWTNFVKYFDPTSEPVGNITWLPSEPSTLRYLNLNTTFEMLEHPRQYQQVKEVLETYMELPYRVFN
ncbi:juvenile hormone esterase-like [Diorhabda sublineata]|uniref:juvenile hormone esterase-like n=1 Tax=Diorhabda sublineata TaxID=1163346 RepID=UPI0024E1834C|nr:juvenile hormone esterase-like [Diorhabda sublineata]